MKKVKFTKAVATGNDFIIIDNRSSTMSSRPAKTARMICDRKRSVGADGMLLLERSRRADFRMRIFNPDGSEAEMCGNGSRCIALYAAARRIASSSMRIETLAGILNADVSKDGSVKVMLTDPEDIRYNFAIDLDGNVYKVSFANTGVPHTVYFVENIRGVDVKRLGASIRRHADFAPAGTNVDFVKILGDRSIKIRTYERGVEDETLACGTGAVASAIISAGTTRMPSPIDVETEGGERLKIYFDIIEGAFRNVCLEGKAKLVFDGIIQI